MVLPLLAVVLALLLVGLPLIRLEFPSIFGVVHASGADERILVKLLVPLLLLGATVAPLFYPNGYTDTLRALLPSQDLQSLLAISLSTIVAVFLASMLHRWTAVPYAFVGALFGCSLMISGHMDWLRMGRIAAAWVAAPVVCGLLTALLTRLFSSYSNKSGRHLAYSDSRLLAGCTLATLLLVATAGWNEGQLLSLLPLPGLGGGELAAAVVVGVAILLYFPQARGIHVRVGEMAEDELDFGTGHTLAILLSMAATFALFSWPGGLPAPLSAGSLLISALVAGSLVRQKAALSGDDIRRHVAATVVAPVMGILLGYCLSLILGASEIRSGSAGWDANPVPVFILLGIVLVLAALFVYNRNRREEALHQQLMNTREEQVASTRKALSALEVRVETNEKDLLNKLDIKRKELVDFAVGVSDQKAFMEKVYEELSHTKELPDGPEKNQSLDEVLSELRERMYFSREMSDFYARSEVLHRDFNMRLKEAFPDLTEGERKLAILLRQGFSSKYIASLMNITPKSVEIGRYRLRIKLGLDRSVNLVQYIKSI